MSAIAAGALDAVTEEAIDWLVLMRSGEATAADRQALEDWLVRSSAHQRAWSHLAGTVDAAFAPARRVNQRHPGQADTLSAALAGSAVRSGRRRRLLQGALAIGGVGVTTGLLADRLVPVGDLLSDWRTATGERRSFMLADGSSLLLNARSAADGATTSRQREVRLRRGEAIVDAAAVAGPFLLVGAHGHLAVGSGRAARFLLRQEEERSLAVALRDSLTLASASGLDRVLRAGEAAWFGPAGIERAPGLAATAAAWQRGQLEVHDRPLGDVIAALRPYRRGFIRISPEAARLRVYGSYPLDDTDRALLTIGETLPLVVHRHSGGWLVRIDVA
ncbi:MAG: DUF4880 domain-containing protein [Pseudomonadota bacterium]